jgi:hypothetical protein
MTLKYKVVLTLFASSLALGLTALNISSGYAAGITFLTAIILFIFGLSTLTFADKHDHSIGSILFDAIFFGIF